mmetsp:Transcript_1768/g.3653  ORF Transcript_1768/g.3653 Transcript_1768/m.3653 type:complete len:344 (-) Transcript_1768:938-1969(-)
MLLYKVVTASASAVAMSDIGFRRLLRQGQALCQAPDLGQQGDQCGLDARHTLLQLPQGQSRGPGPLQSSRRAQRRLHWVDVAAIDRDQIRGRRRRPAQPRTAFRRVDLRDVTWRCLALIIARRPSGNDAVFRHRKRRFPVKGAALPTLHGRLGCRFQERSGILRQGSFSLSLRGWRSGLPRLVFVFGAEANPLRVGIVQPVLDVVEQTANELPQFHNVSDGRLIRPSESEHDLHEVFEAERLHRIALISWTPFFVKDEVGEVHNTRDVDAHLLQRLHGLGGCENLRELILRDQHVVVSIERHQDLLQLSGHEVHHHVFLLRRRDQAHHFTEHSDEHVHDSEVR